MPLTSRHTLTYPWFEAFVAPGKDSGFAPFRSEVAGRAGLGRCGNRLFLFPARDELCVYCECDAWRLAPCFSRFFCVGRALSLNFVDGPFGPL